MHCFACNVILSNPQPDTPTSRYYCENCFSWTTEEQLRLAGKDYYDFTDEPIELNPEEVQLDIKDSKDQDDYSENF